MVVEANLEHDFLERVWKLVLICEKIRKTMNGPAKITIDNSRGEYVSLESQAVVRAVMAKAGVKDWQAVQHIVISDNLMLGERGTCSVMAGMRRSQTFIDREGLWFQGNDETREHVSVKVDRKAAGTHGMSTKDRFLTVTVCIELALVPCDWGCSNAARARLLRAYKAQ
jgi:hypothetical protein